MASTNQGPEYFAAEKRYLLAESLEEKIRVYKDLGKFKNNDR